MPNINITQLHRVVFIRKTGADTKTFTLEPDDLGQEDTASINIAPRKMTRDSSIGSTSTPIAGTYDAFAASISFLLDNWAILGNALNRFNKATYDGANANAGNIIGSAATTPCAGGDYCTVIIQGVCDDGSSADVELPRCIPSMDDDVTVGSSSTPEVTLNLNPIIYNPKLHADDGYSKYDYRLGDQALDKKTRLNATTGEYEDVVAGD